MQCKKSNVYGTKINFEEKVVIAKRNELGTISPLYYTSFSLMKK